MLSLNTNVCIYAIEQINSFTIIHLLIVVFSLFFCRPAWTIAHYYMLGSATAAITAVVISAVYYTYTSKEIPFVPHLLSTKKNKQMSEEVIELSDKWIMNVSMKLTISKCARNSYIMTKKGGWQSTAAIERKLQFSKFMKQIYCSFCTLLVAMMYF